MIYSRHNDFVCFLLPTIAIGMDMQEEKYFFVEFVWFGFVVGISNGIGNIK